MVGKLKDSSAEVTWAPIPSFPRYEASTAGEVRRIGATHPKTPTPTSDGYLAVAVVGDDGPRTRLVHRLVAEAFLGDITGLVVHHKNGCGMDPRLCNLAVMSQAENVRRSFADGTAGTLRGERRPEVWGRGRLTAQQVMALRRAKASGKRGAIAELARAYNVSYHVAHAAASGEKYDWGRRDQPRDRPAASGVRRGQGRPQGRRAAQSGEGGTRRQPAAHAARSGCISATAVRLVDQEGGQVSTSAPSKLLTVRQVADRLGVSTDTIYQWSYLGKLPKVKLGKRLRFDSEVIERVAREGF